MAPEKSTTKPPAFWLYVQDFLHGTKLLTLKETGAYIILLCHQWDDWDNRAIPAGNEKVLARMLGCNIAEARSAWREVSKKFVLLESGLYQNQKLERVRNELIAFTEGASNRGRKGAEARWRHSQSNGTANAQAMPEHSLSNAKPMPKNGSSPSPSISMESANALSTRVREAPLVVSPIEWERQHGKHVGGFCDWVCLPRFIALEFAGKANHSGDIGPILTWARNVRDEWESRTVGDDSLVFWRKRWAEAHPDSGTKISKTKAVLRQFIAGGTDVA